MSSPLGYDSSFDRPMDEEAPAQQSLRDCQLSEPVSELEQTQAQLRQSQQRLESILNSIEGVVWSIHPETFETIYINPAVEKIFGCSVAEFLANPNLWFEIIHPDDQDTITNVFARLKEHGKTRAEYRIIRRDGQVRWLSVNSYLVYDETGKPIRIDGITTDISDRIESEIALRNSENKFRSIIENLNDMVYIINLDGTFSYISPNFKDVMGYELAELLDSAFPQWIHPEDLPICVDAVQRSFQGEKLQGIEYRVLHQNGNYYWHSSNLSALRDNDGQVVSCLGIARYIHDQKQVKIALEESNSRWQLAIEGAGDGTWDWNIKTNQLIFSRQWKAMLGYEEDEIVNDLVEWDSRVPPEDKARCYEDFAKHLKGEIPTYRNEHRLRCKDGSYKWILARGQVIEWDKEGQPLRFIGTHSDISDRKYAEINLRQNEQKYHNILDAITDMVLVKGPKSRIVWANKAFRDYYALTNEQLTDMIDAPFNEPDYTLQYIRDDAYVFETGQTLEIEESVTRYDGKLQIFNTIKSVIRNEAGEKILTVGVSRDISDRKQAEDALRASEEKLRSLFDLCPVGISLNDMQGNFLEVNSAAETIYGYSLEELNQLSYWDLTPEKYADQEASQLELINTTGRYGPYQKEYIRKDGSLLPVELLGVVVTNNDGNQYIWSIIVDLTDRQRQEQSLRLIVEGTAAKTGEEFFKSCVQYLAQVLEVRYAVISEFVDSEKSIVKTLAFWAEDDFCDNFTYSLAGTPCKNVASNTEVCRYPNSVQQLFPEDDYLVTIQAESYAGLSIIDTAGNHLGLLTVLDTKPMVKDLEMQSAILKIFATRAGAEIERIKAEAAVRQSEIQLRLQSEELTTTLKRLQTTQTQLIQSEKMSSLGQLVAGIAHEINNPVSFIYGNLQPATDYASDLIELIQLYQEHYPSPPLEISEFTEAIDFDYLVSDFSNLLESMKTGATRISSIVKSLRTFSRLDEADLKPIDIHENIESTLVILQNRLHGSTVKTEISVVKNYGNLPLIECYGSLLNQVFLNLLVNAIDAIEQQRESREPTERLDDLGEITITTSINSENQVFISIQDNGCGMSPEVQEKIFNPFFTTKPVGKGTGMGLATSYQIITENHQGHLRCCSTLGKGTEFRIELPVG